jgi:hypothetical protein
MCSRKVRSRTAAAEYTTACRAPGCTGTSTREWLPGSRSLAWLRVRCLPEVRAAGGGLPAAALRAVPGREAGGFQLQEAWLLPLARRKAHGRDGSAAGRRGAARAAAAPVGAVTADGAALSAGHPPCGALRSARRGAPHDLGSSAGPCGSQARRGPYGCGHADPAFRLGVESERALSHALRRWRVRDRGVWSAGVPGGEITGRGRTSGVGAAAG